MIAPASYSAASPDNPRSFAMVGDSDRMLAGWHVWLSTTTAPAANSLRPSVFAAVRGRRWPDLCLARVVGDQLLGYAASAAGRPGMTIRLELSYRAPVPLLTPLRPEQAAMLFGSIRHLDATSPSVAHD
ncbi:hypothetical protein JOF56_008943 [Kibdelosporangium banguiense]|uniref:Uncharacterized protein n=1 Tax=Kibdelosporangium banguiense TaxID=1365924 RepID=A0ABS4TW15_9PSEU|nr:hypothetical protein [Kibdelosporangium banguiense]